MRAKLSTSWLMKDVNGAGRSIEERFSLDRFVFCRISKINFVNLIYAREYILLNPFIEILKWIILSKILRSSTILNRQIFFLLRMDNYFYMTRIKIKFVIKSYFTLSCICEYILNFQFFNQVTNPKTLIHLF